MTRNGAAQKQGLQTPAQLAAALEESQEHLRRLEAHFRTTIEQIPIGIAHFDMGNRIVRFNATFRDMLGFGADELIGKSFAELTYADDMRGSAAAIRRLWRGEVASYAIEKRYIKKSGDILWARVTVAPSQDASGAIDGAIGILEDISERKAADAEIERVQKELLRASRQAGMAEVATNVLHNVGNVLNSLNVSANLLADHIRGSKVDAFARSAALLQEQTPRLGTFLTEDERGKRLPEFLAQLSAHMLANRDSSLAELESLTGNIDHIKDIVNTQQTYARRCGVTETVDVATLVEDSLAMNRGAFARHGVELIRAFAPVPQITIDKHKVLQILVNLERNAKYACDASGKPKKQITVSIAPCEHGVRIQVIDNGIGISPENMPRLFTHGFTTKKEGHGFGLHSGALAARELGGTLEAESDGVGHGATFTLTLPLIPPQQSHG